MESDGAGQLTPRLLEVNEHGLLLFAEAGLLARGASVNITYHFLGLDGSHLVHALGQVPILAQTPELGRADVGGAHASSRGGPYEALLLTPWNLLAREATVGLTARAGGEVIEDVVVTACADWELERMEPGCRLVYALPFPPALTSLEVWHEDEEGARVVDRVLSRAQLVAGFTFSP